MKKKILALAISAALITTSVPTMATQVFAEGVSKVVSSAQDLLAPRGEKQVISSGSCGNGAYNGGANVLWELYTEDGETVLRIYPTDSPEGENMAMRNYNYNNRAPWKSNTGSITKVVVEYGVTSIGEMAFHECNSLTMVSLPNSIKSIGYSAFTECSALTSVTIPDSVISIEGQTFSGCSSLTSVTIPESVKVIENRTFSSCRALTSVTIPDGVTSIGSYAFSSCEALTSVTIPESVTYIGPWAFSSCEALTSIEIPCGVIDDQAFIYCSKMDTITLGDNVTSLGSGAFAQTAITAIRIPDSVDTMGSNPFSGCQSLTNIVVEQGNTKFAVGNDNVLFSIDEQGNYVTLVTYPLGSDDTIYVVPNGVVSIGESACSSRKKPLSMILSNTVESIGNNAFSSSRGLNVVLSDSVISYGRSCFMSTRALFVEGYKTDEEKAAIKSDITVFMGKDFFGCPVIYLEGGYIDDNTFTPYKEENGKRYAFAGYYTPDGTLLGKTFIDDAFTDEYDMYVDDYLEANAKWTPIIDVEKAEGDDMVLPTTTLGGLELLGVQIRDENYTNPGLRFITSFSEDLVDTLGGEEVVEYGYVVGVESNVTNENTATAGVQSARKSGDKLGLTRAGEIQLGTAGTVKVDCTKTNKGDHKNFNAYRVYSLVIQYDDEAQKAEDIVARAYVIYKDAQGTERVLYGEYTGTLVYGGCCTDYNSARAAIGELELENGLHK